MKYTILFFALLNVCGVSAQYRITRGKIAGWSVLAVAGFTDGVVEGFEFDGRKSFERKYNVQPVSCFGSESWKLAYYANDPEQPKKPLWSVIGAPDFYHLADDVRKIGYISGGITIGISGAKANTKWWHYAVDFGASLAISGMSKAAGMYCIRH